MDLFRVRLNCIDHYQSSPTQFDPQLRSNVAASQKQNEPSVPVIRVFGSTETGQKVCAHIHGAFPYIYVEYTGSLDQDEVGAYMHRLHLSIDHALAVSYRRNVYDGKNRFVARITLVKGTPFYGYHVGYQYFLKIYILNPIVMTRLSDLLRQGVIMRKIFQPYEGHLQYLLQWMTDYNLYGCGYINCRQVYFRGDVPKYEETQNLAHLWHDRSIPPAFRTREDVLPRVSHCSIEVDICAHDILNRLDIKPRPLHHDFIERHNPLAPDEKLVHSMAGLWRDETRRRKSKMVNPDPGSSPFPPEVLISMSADPRHSQMGGWIHEEEYMETVKTLISDERDQSEKGDVSFETFVVPNPQGLAVKTALESVEDLYPENLAPMLGLQVENFDFVTEEKIKNGTMEVDVNRIFDYHDDEVFSYDSEEETVRETDFSERQEVDHHDKSSQVTGITVGAEVDSLTPAYESETETKPKDDECLIPANESLAKDPNIHLAAPHIHLAQTDARLKPSLKRYASTNSQEKGNQKRSKLNLPTGSLQKKASELHQLAQSAVQLPSILNNKLKDKNGDEGSQSNQHLLSAAPTVNGVSHKTIVAQKSSQGLINPSGRLAMHGLNFPVVKDPQDPSTISRLSQISLSQTSPDNSPGKTVSFDSMLTSPKINKVVNLTSPSKTSEISFSSHVSSEAMSSLLVLPSTGTTLVIAADPPNPGAVLASMEDFGLPAIIYQDAYYSVESDVPERAREWAGREFKIESLTAPFLPPFDATGSSAATYGLRQGLLPDTIKEGNIFRLRRRACGLRSWEIAEPCPTYSEVTIWLNDENIRKGPTNAEYVTKSQPVRSLGAKADLSQIEGPTQNKNGAKYSQKQNTTSVHHEAQYMSTMSLEVHINTRGKFVPNPEEDEIQCIFWCLQSDEGDTDKINTTEDTKSGIVVLSEDGSMTQKVSAQIAVEVREESSELDLLIRIVEIVRNYDPDILTGYEVHGGSWGYLIERARLKYDYNLCDEFSRMRSQSHGHFGKDNDKWGFNNTSTIRVTGRHMINIWRAMRSELNLLQYTMENVVFHLLHQRIPHYAWRDLTLWYESGSLKNIAKIVDYFLSRVRLDLEILNHSEIIPRTSEQARVLGVDFFSVFSRGSQFKVESLMFRIAKAENFLLVSPSRKQVGGQNALECLPLVMEPQSAFYTSPVLVLDFQSLYPSVMIAYNYCYSTFLGRIVNWRGTNKMGFTEFKRQQRLLELLKDHINIAPNGIMYVKPEIRKSLLAKMLGEILETRVMVKSGMKIDKDDKTLQHLLNNRQLALKLIANVTYGYTSASFSGRMPCSEIADSIVQTGRETLEKAIALIHSVKRWGAEVVYGDTDSLFIHLKGRTKDQAFEIGNDIAKTITNISPRPVKLKFEKVYFPCVLLAKKRYVGFKYESKDQEVPDFDAKGIETVRRDGTPAEQKIEEKALKILFRTADLSQVKDYFQKQCEKIMKGSVSIQDFCFAKEVKLGTYSEKGLPTPGALISTKRMLEDHRAEPQYGERVPYVVITGAPGARLIDRCVAPETLLNSDHTELDSEYYISKNLIPPLERIFNLVGANVRSWYDEMPKVQRIRQVDASLQLVGHPKDQPLNRKTLESYMKSSLCLVCREKIESEDALCPHCMANRAMSLLLLQHRLSVIEKKSRDTEKICQSCSGISWLDEVRCDSKDCPVFYTRTKERSRLTTERSLVLPVMSILQGSIDMAANDLDW